MTTLSYSAWTIIPVLFSHFYLQMGIYTSICLGIAIGFLVTKHRTLYILCKTLPRDVRGGYLLISMKLKAQKLMKEKKGVQHLFNQVVNKCPNKACFIFEGQTWTFRDVDEYSNRVCNWCIAKGYKVGDVVALYGENNPEYVGIWLGMAKAGVVTALINYNLKTTSLIHCVRAANAKSLIYSINLAEAINEIRSEIESLPLYHTGAGMTEIYFEGTNIDVEFLSSSKDSKFQRSAVEGREHLFYIYTSGTTGLPKAAIISHIRFFTMASGVTRVMGVYYHDIVYTPLPLYHSAGGILGVGQAILSGITVVIARKFSASNFWSECVKYNCTVSQYIGETCRYLLAQPEQVTDVKHRVRMMFGNGLKPQIWSHFQKRFNVTQICEFYGATESNSNIVNIDNTVGAVGFLSRFIPLPIKLIKVDESSGEPIRSNTGLCSLAKPNEVGEIIGAIVKGDVLREVDGYVSKSATEKKILKDVFVHGDAYFATGDVVVMDEFGYIYFKDRLGDTFRWKGENVSTSEVEAVISNIISLKDATVYGVEVPGAEGRAGMAAIADPDKHGIDMELLSREIIRKLPSYAQPKFIRLVSAIQYTGTFKLQKVDLRNQGYDPKSISDDLFYFDFSSKKYLPLTTEVYDDICNQKLKI